MNCHLDLLMQKGAAISGSPFLHSPMRAFRKTLKIKTHYIPPVFLTVSLLVLYAKTIAPGLTWANGGTDGGDLITATALGGIAHPSGYPLYLLLARGFQILPIGDLAYRTNLMSALFAVMNALLVYFIVYRNGCEKSITSHKTVAALSAGYAIGLAPLFWSQAVITEVYTLNAFFVALILHLSLFRVEGRPVLSKRLDSLRGLIYGLACGNHLSLLPIIPVAMLVSGWQGRVSSSLPATASPKNQLSRFNWMAIKSQAAWMLIGMSVYIALPLRALHHPVVNWGNPVNLENFWWLVSGSLYRSYYFPDSLLQLWFKMPAMVHLFLEQFGIPGVILIFIELVIFAKPTRLMVVSGWIGLISCFISLAYQSPDATIYLIPFFLSCAIWIGQSVEQLLANLAGQKLVWTGLFTLSLALYFGSGILSNFPRVDASRDDRAEIFGETVMSVAPKEAILFVEGDPAVFALWYFHFALGERSDLTVLATDLLHFDWYQETLRTTYPTLVVPAPFPFASTIISANPLRTTCFVRYETRTLIQCTEPQAIH